MQRRAGFLLGAAYLRAAASLAGLVKMRASCNSLGAIAALALGLASWAPGWAAPSVTELQAAYQLEVGPRLDIPPEESLRYGLLVLDAMAQAERPVDEPQYVVLVDRSPHVQAIFIYWLEPRATPRLVGASPVSTGRGGEFDHFRTPLGVYAHTPANPDFRAEGTPNANGVRGYGTAGMRVFDFGWQQAERLWGRGGLGTMRLQMHATDPNRLEPRLGSTQSKGCIRIPASLNRLLDHYGVLDADYLREQASGVPLWILPRTQVPVDHPGRYLIIVETERAQRPAWSPSPALLGRGSTAPSPP